MHQFPNNEGKALSSLEWLVNHHRAKEIHRRKVIQSIGFSPGMSAIDIGCGPGLWSQLIAAELAPHGSLTAIDIDESLIGFARDLIGHKKNPSRINFEIADYRDLAQFKSRFDAAFFSNCLVYSDDPVKSIKDARQVLKSNGMFVAHHFDNSFWTVHPVPPQISQDIFTGVSRRADLDLQGNHFDNAFGQKLHGTLICAGLRNVSTTTHAVTFTQPLTQAAEDYLCLSAEWFAEMAKPYVDRSVISEWQKLFNPSNRSYILNRRDLFISMLEMTSIGFQA